MKDLVPPNVEVSAHRKEFRATLLNTKKSAYLGVILLILPFLFLSGVILKHYLQIDFGMLTSVYEWIGDYDRAYGDNSVINWVIRMLLLLGPLAATAINLLAIMHIRYEKPQRELIFSLKLKWHNVVIIAICSLVFVVFFSYLIMENLH